MSALKADEFAAYFNALYGHRPFLWQERLFQEVTKNGEWPRTIAAPTGAGKTAVLDVALFHLAMEAGSKSERRAPVRICFAVDRRIIVDQAHDRALKIRKALAEAHTNSILGRVAEVLRQFGGSPLHVEQLRGGMPREDDWVKTPAQPTILCTTVDQLGSRLLFRGYGVSERMAPVHGGLLGEDCLILLDEAHLSAAFAETLDGVSRRRKEREREGPAHRWGFCELTATPRRGAERRFELAPREKNEENIRKRLAAAKMCELIECSADRHQARLIECAQVLATESGRADPVVAIIVNRVPLARAVFEAIAKETPESEAILLTGRVRPVERDALIKQYRHRLFAGERATANGPIFVIATQCIEAGADFDFDAMVTQIAPLDALGQRFGRLDRLGAKSLTRAVLIAAKDEIAKSAKPDPIYGDRAKRTWEWLNATKGEAPSIDFGPNAMQALIDADPEGARACMADAKQAPILRAADVTFLSMTHPRPHPDPEISLFLHGELGRDTDVSIVWRADIEDCFGEDDVERLGTVLDLVRPRPGEALRVPVWQARAWLRRKHDSKAPLADVDTQAPPGEGGAGSERRLARRKHDDREIWEFVDASALTPGDTLVASSSYGGCDEFGWSPESLVPVEDIAEAAGALYERHCAFLRVHKAIWCDDALPWAEIAARIAAGLGARAILEGVSSARAQQFLAPNLGLRLDIDAYGETEGNPRGAIIVAPRGIPTEENSAEEADGGDAVTDDGDVGSFMSKQLLLSIHREDVEAKARAFSEAVGLDAEIVASLALAARLHDDGKADERFQAYLSGGAVPAAPLAKSGRRRLGEDRTAYKRSGLPKRWRHEALSVRLAIEQLALKPRADIDDELVLWLVGTHHGYGRPFFPHDDPWDDSARTVDGVDLPVAPGPQRFDFEWGERHMDWAQLFEALKRRYGIWGLAYLEAIVRLADHRASEMRERGA